MVLVLVVVQIRAFAPPLGSWLARSAVVVSPCAVPLPARLLFSPGPAPPFLFLLVFAPESGYSPFSLKTCSSSPTRTRVPGTTTAPFLHVAPAPSGHHEQPSPEAVHVRAQAPQALRTQPAAQGRPRTAADPRQRGKQEVNAPAPVTESPQACRICSHRLPLNPSLINFCKSTPDHLVSNHLCCLLVHFALPPGGRHPWRHRWRKPHPRPGAFARQRSA